MFFNFPKYTKRAEDFYAYILHIKINVCLLYVFYTSDCDKTTPIFRLYTCAKVIGITKKVVVQKKNLLK